MAVRLTQVRAEPIILCKYLGMTTRDDLKLVRWQSDGLATQMAHPPIFRVTDMSHTTNPIPTIVALMNQPIIDSSPGSMDDPRIIDLFVVNPKVAAWLSDGFDLRIFVSLYDALIYARHERSIARRG